MTCKKNRGRSAKPSKCAQKAVQQEQPEKEQVASIEDFNNSVDTSFFYTSDKKLNAIDDEEVIQKLVEKHPDFVQQSKDTLLRKTFLEILDDEELVADVLEYYSLTMHDFFKIVYKQYSSLFNTLFIKKVREKIASKYA